MIMATYASSSNPFIKATGGELSSVDLAPKRKDAPGMALPHSQLTDKLKLKDKELYSSNSKSSENDTNLPPVNLETAEKENELKGTQIDIIVDLDSNLSPTVATEERSQSKSEFDEITKACESLVETTIRLELEEAASSSSSLKEKTTCAESDTIHTGHISLNHENRLQDSGCALMKAEPDIDGDDNDADEQVPEERDKSSGHRQHIELIRKLRLQLRDLERYAYERGELGQVPASMIAERQTVILDTLKERLSLSIDINEIEKLELDELKVQIDKEIHDLIDPLITKDHLLSQLKTQLTDLERYTTYLHGTIDKIHDKSACTCHVHGCCTSNLLAESTNDNDENSTTTPTKNESRLNINNDTTSLPKTSKLIRSLVTQLICSDIKLRESAEKAQILEEKSISDKRLQPGGSEKVVPPNRPPQRAEDDAAWTLHIDKVILATDSLVNLFTTEPEYKRSTTTGSSSNSAIDDRLIESIVRRQLVPAIRDLLSYGLIDLSSMPKSTSYVSLLFDPYYLLTSLTCFPSSNRAASPIGSGSSSSSTMDKVHLWNVIEEYYQSRNDSTFKTSSVKTLSQSFDLAPSISGPIKITSKQALLIAIDDINETLSRSKPNGPESHFRAFIYTALNRTKLTTWFRIVFKNKSIIRRFYHNFSFVGQPEKMEKLLATLEPLNEFSFKLRTDVESIEQFVSAF